MIEPDDRNAERLVRKRARRMGYRLLTDQSLPGADTSGYFMVVEALNNHVCFGLAFDATTAEVNAFLDMAGPALWARVR